MSRAAGGRDAAHEAVLPLEHPAVELLVVERHPLQRESLLRGLAALTAVDLAHPVNCADHLPLVAAEIPGPARIYDLRRSPVREGKHRRGAGKRLRHHQSEWLPPGDRVQQRVGLAQQLDPAAKRHLSRHLVAGVEQRPDLRLEVADLLVLAHLGGQQQLLARLLGDPDRMVHALVGRHPPDEHDVTAATGTSGVHAEVDPVMDDSGNRDAAVLLRLAGLRVRDGHQRAVLGDLGEDGLRLAVKRAVVGVHNRRPAHAAQARHERPQEGVVVDHVHVRERLVGGQHVGRLRNGHADRCDRLRVQEVGLNRARRLAHREQPDLVTEFLQAAGKVVDDDLGPAVRRRWNWDPWRGNQADPHLHCLLVSSRVTITLRQRRAACARH